MIKNKISLILFLFAASPFCSTIIQVPSSRAEIKLPEALPVKDVRVISGSNASKEKREKKERIQIVVVDNIDRADDSSVTLLIAKKRILKLLLSSRVDYVDPPEDVAAGIKKKSETVREYLIKNNIDAVLFVFFNKKDEAHEYSLKLMHASDFRPLSELTGPVRIISKSLDTAHRSDIYSDGKSYSFLKEINLSSVDISSPGETSIQDFWASVTTGLLHVRSSTPGSEVSLFTGGKKILIGRTPLNDFRLDEGEYEIEIFRKGFAPVRKNIEVIAGADTNVFIPWPDDPYTTSLAFWTEPASMRFTLDGEVIGETPVFINDMEGGSYDVSLAKKNSNGSYSEAIKTQLVVRQAQVNTLVFFYKYFENFGADFLSKEYWHRVSDNGGFDTVSDKGLSFSGKSGSTFGVESMDFPVRSFDARLKIEAAADDRISFGVRSLMDSVLIQSGPEGFAGGVFGPDEKAIAMQVFKDKDPAKKEHTLRIKYKSSSSMVQLYVDGTSVGAYGWKPNSTGRFVIYSQSDKTRFKLLKIEMKGK